MTWTSLACQEIRKLISCLLLDLFRACSKLKSSQTNIYFVSTVKTSYSSLKGRSPERGFRNLEAF